MTLMSSPRLAALIARDTLRARGCRGEAFPRQIARYHGPNARTINEINVPPDTSVSPIIAMRESHPARLGDFQGPSRRATDGLLLQSVGSCTGEISVKFC